jgi:tRNA modification GTPase
LTGSDTITALATAPGKAALAILRISGPATAEILTRMGAAPGRPRHARRVRLVDVHGEAFDDALVIWFPGPASVTGEDVAELHLHGGRYVVETALNAVLSLGARLAEPGEFTRRAFEHGKLSLDAAEGVADLIDAANAAQARQALLQLEGALGQKHQAWRDKLIDLLARLEALVDFPEDLVDSALEGVSGSLTALRDELVEALGDGRRGRAVREGYRVALVGPPNAGKSSLFNALTGRDTAIVTDVPGTTRDIIEAELEMAGFQVRLADTAGLRSTGEVVEAEGVRRARAWAADAETRLWVIDPSDRKETWRDDLALWSEGDLLILHKADQGVVGAHGAIEEARARGLDVMSHSTHEAGAGAVRLWLEDRVVAMLGSGEFPAATRRRHEACLSEAIAGLERAAAELDEPELAAEDVRLAARALAQVAGRVATEDVLDRVFAAFCIGK